MTKLAFLRPVLGALLFLGCATGMAQVRITEFMASNTHTLADEDGDYSDWIELQNASMTNVNLVNWALSDSSANPGKWLFPSTNLPPGAFMVVFASGKNRRVPGAPLHTNFKLSATGEYLALSRPDLSIATEFSPCYPQQFPDVSYGLVMAFITTPLVATNATIHYLIPTNSSADGAWQQTGFNDSTWRVGTNGIGYETGLSNPGEESFAAKVLASQPVAYWRLNETSGVQAVNSGTDGVADAAGYLGNIVLGGAGPRPPKCPTLEATNCAPVFDGVSAAVNGPYELVNDLPAFTIAGWINPATSQQNNRAGLFGQNDTMEFGFSSYPTIQIWTPVGAVSATYPFATNQWHYITAVGGNGRLSLFFDATNVGSTSISAANFGESLFNFNIGGDGVFDPTGNYFKGGIDEVAVWYRALATNEITGFLATNVAEGNYSNYINTDVRALMYGSNATACVRIPFSVADPSAFNSLSLLVRYNAGFAAFLNGQQIASANAPAALAWNSTATQLNLNPRAVQWQEFDLSAAQPYLQAGNNVLAIQGLNVAATNADFLLQAQLLGQTVTNSLAAYRYFSGPTPGGPNGTSTNDLGPILSGASHTPNPPQVTDSLLVTAPVAPEFNAISNVTLHYCVMFNAEIAAPMNDSGTNGDAVGGDGIWTGKIPAGVAAAGQLIRYYVTASDTAGNASRWPIFPDPAESEQYYGTVVADPSIQSQLPVAYLFIQNPSAADNRTGTQASLFYLNELYDNLSIYVHGQTSTGWPKKSHDLVFPKDHDFLYSSNATREKKVVFMSDYSDKASIRTTLTYAAIAQSGGVGFFSFPIRIHLNGSYWGLEDMVEYGDALFLDRIGRDDNGALYKMYNEMSTASGNVKETRQSDPTGTADLTALITNLDESIALATRVAYAYDNLDLPQTASYFADMALTSDQDVGHKNFYLYRDSDNTGEWTIFPWDVDLSWGRNWVDEFSGSNYFNDVMFTTNVLNFYPGAPIQSKPANRLFDLFFASGDFSQMYLRRLRTLMDTILMPAGTPASSQVLEPLIRQYENTLNPPGMSPSDTALDYAAWGPTWGDTNLSYFPNDAERLISVFLAGRRAFLYTSPYATLNGSTAISISNSIPAAQPTNAAVLIASSDYAPVSGNPAEQYVQLRNTNSYAVDVSNWRLTGAIEILMRPGTVIPAGKSLYLAASVNAFRARAASPHAGQNLFVQGPFAGFLSAQGNSALILENDRGAVVNQNSFAGNFSPLPFTAGNLAVVRVGDGAESLSSHGNSLFVDQFTTNGALAGSVAIPDESSNAFLASGSATSEGGLTLSPDQRLLLLAGYNMAYSNSTSSLPSAGAATVPRVIGALDASGNFAILGLTTNQYSSNNFRSATTDGLGNYWGAGANSGTFYFGGNLPATVQSTVANSVIIQDLGGSLYFSTSKSTPGIWKIPGTPVCSASASLFLATGPDSSPFAFAFNSNFTTAYVSDDTLAGKGGIQRWDLNGSAWSLTYTFLALTNVGARGLTVDFTGAHPILYATTAESSANRIVTLTDTGAASIAATLATAGINQLYRGIAFAPSAGVAPQFYGAASSAQGFRLSWTALLDRNYTVEYSGDISTTNWQFLTNLTAVSAVVSICDPSAPSPTNRFYRVILNP
ncbi:MAG: CotH kinase family protein [Verrucomicrobiota bacterium]